MEQNLPEKNSKKVINAWCSYDIANSAYSLSISTAIFPIYYNAVMPPLVNLFGSQVANPVLLNYSIAAGYFLIVFLTPLLSGIADLCGYRKRFMQIFTIIGSLSCMGLYFFSGDTLWPGIVFPATAVIGFAGSLVYYNSFLPIIATADKHDQISARGFMFGYAGSMLLLIINLITIMKPEMFGFIDSNGKGDSGAATRFAFLTVGVWWLIIGQIAIWFLREYPSKTTFRTGILANGYREVKSVMIQVTRMPAMRNFLMAFFFLSTGVQTVILVAALFGSSELGIEGPKLIATILIIQVVAIIGAWVFGKVSSRLGNKISLVIMLTIWIIICVSAYFIKSEMQFYILGALVGLVMGGIQSQARSTFAKLIPDGTMDTASFFSFYDITEKVAIVVGMFGFGFIQQTTGSMRNSTMFLGILFLISLIIVVFSSYNQRKQSI